MKSWIRNTLVALALLSLAGGSASQVALAQAAAPGKAAQRTREAHPVVQRAIRQLEGVKDELQRAPEDFHGHKEAAIDAVTHAINDLRQALAADKK